MQLPHKPVLSPSAQGNGFYMQSELTGIDWGGVWVYFSSSLRSSSMLSSRTEGDYVEVVSMVEEYYDLTELINPSSVTLLSSGHALTPRPITTGELGTNCTRAGEQLEGLLVTLTNANITGGPNQYGEITIDDGSGPTQLEDGLLNTDGLLAGSVDGSLVGTVLTSVTGVVRYAYESFEVHPRYPSDLVLPGYNASAASTGQSMTLSAINYVPADGDACASSPVVGTTVLTRGYVSAIAYNGFYMQQTLMGMAWSGIWVYFSFGSTAPGLAGRAIGDYVEVVALVEEYYDLTELINPSSVTLISSGHTLTPLEISTGALGTDCTRAGEQYEGLLVRVSNAQILSEPNQYGEITIDDGSGPTQLEDGLFDSGAHLGSLVSGSLVGTRLYSVTGVVRFSFSSFEIHPRSAADIELSTPIIFPPVPPLAFGEAIVQTVATVVTLDLHIAGDVSSFGQAEQASFTSLLRNELECYEDNGCLIDLLISSASVNVQARITIPEPSAGSGNGGGSNGGGSGSLGAGSASAVAARANALSSRSLSELNSVLGVTVERAPTVAVDASVAVPLRVGPPPPSPSPPPPGPPPSEPRTETSSTVDEVVVMAILVSVGAATFAITLGLVLLCLRGGVNNAAIRMAERRGISSTQMTVFGRSGAPKFVPKPPSEVGKSELATSVGQDTDFTVV